MPFYSLSQSAKPWDKMLTNGLMIEVSDDNKVDTIKLEDVISGVDKVSYFIDQYGDTVNHKTLNNQVILIDFWFLNCPPCIAEITGYDYLSTKFKDKPFKVLSFSLDKKTDVEQKILSKRDFKFSVITDSRLIGKPIYPLKILIDKKGIIRKVESGGTIAPNAPQILREEYSPLITRWLSK